MRVRETPGEERQPFLREVAGGLRLVAERQWLWVSLASFALGNVALASYLVIGPVIAERELDGARDWESVGMKATLGFGAALAVLAMAMPLCFAGVHDLRRSPSPAFGSAGELPVPVPPDPLP